MSEDNVVEFPQQPELGDSAGGQSGGPAVEAPPADTTTETESGKVTAPADMSIEEQIKALEQKLDELDNLRMKSVVEELDFDAAALAIVASDQAEERYKRAWKEGVKLIKQCAWSGMRKVAIESKLPAMSAQFVQDLHKHKFKAKIVTINNQDQIEVRW